MDILLKRTEQAPALKPFIPVFDLALVDSNVAVLWIILMFLLNVNG